MAFTTPVPPAPFVYFNTLAEVPETASIWTSAVNMVQQIDSQVLTANDKKDVAVNFLRQASQFQRQGEIEFVLNYRKKLKKMYTNAPTDELKSKIDELTTLLQNIYTNSGFDYHAFTAALNIVTKDSENFKGRLSTLLENIKHKKKEHTLLTDVNKEYKNIIGLLTKQKELLLKEKESYEAIVSEFIFDYINKNEKKIQEAVLDDGMFAAWILKLTVSFRAFMEKKRAATGFEKIPKDYEQKKQYLEKQFKEFIDPNSSDLLRFSDDDLKLLKSISSNMEFQKISDIVASESTREYMTLPTLQPYTRRNNRIAAFTSNFSSPALSERLNILVKKSFDLFLQTGGSNMGDDSLGAVVINYDTPNFQEEIDKIDEAIHKIDAAMTKFSKLRTDREKVLGANAAMNKEIEDILKNLDEYLGSQDDGQKAFIIHDSDKYYYSIEQGYEGAYHKHENKRVDGFGGRTMSILNYIDVMNNLATQFGVDTSNFYFVALNLGPYTAGEGTNAKSNLEKIFTYTAGMVMFDDIATAVKEAIKEIEFSNITNIHLYQLQGLFFPSSYILEQTANYLSGCQYDETDAAVAQIQIGESIYAPGYKNMYEKGSKDYNRVNNALNNFMSQNSAQRWNTIKSDVSAQTKVSIHFFLNFQQFISQIPH